MSFLKMNHIKQLYNSSANKSGVPEIDVNYGVDKDLAKLVIPWALPDIKKYCFLNAHVIDVVSGVIMKNKQVLTEEGYITRIEDADAVVPEGYYKIECKGKYLCPGLFDNHVHLQCVPGETDLTKLMLMPKNTAMTRTARNAENMLRRGFTSLRDCGGTDPCFKEAINEGSIYGPRLFLAGHAISQTGGHGHMVPRELPGDAFDSCSCHMNLLGVVADGVPQCYKAAREELRRGATFVKIMASGGVASPTDKVTNIQYCEDEIQALVRVAESYGTYVTAHAYTPQSIRHCILNGVKGIEHGNLIDEESAKLMADYGCYLTPTLVSYKIMASDQFGSFLGPENKEKNKMVLKEGLNSLKIAKRNNVKICFGSDLLGSLVGYQTQEFYIRGLVLSPKDVLFSSTVEPANMNDVGHKLGQIKTGYLADILILEENPLENISVLDNPEKTLKLVMKEGRVYQSKIPGVSIDV